jgi:hypothetical protein
VPHSSLLGNGSNIPPTVAIIANDPIACEFGSNPGRFSIVNISSTNTSPMQVNFSISGTASNGVDYALLSGTATIPANSVSTNIFVTPLGTSLPGNFSTVTLSLAPSTNYTLNSLNSATVTILDRPVNVWLRTNFTIQQRTNALVSGDSATPAGDGIPNLLKYGMGLSPFMAYSNVFNPSVTGGNLSLTCMQSLSAIDAGLLFDYSTNLISWTNNQSFFLITTNSIQGGTQTLQLKTSSQVNPFGNAFFRVRATRL